VIIRDRIKELKRVKASDLIPNPKNWRTHPVAQQDALKGVLAEVGYADALLARETPDGLMLVDGHLRAETTPDMDVPVLVLDIDEAESDLMLATLDPLAAMAGRDEERLSELLATVTSDNDTVNALLQTLANGYEPLTLPDITIPDGALNQENPEDLLIITLRMDQELWQLHKTVILGWQELGVIVDVV
jgi:ParB-like chromosome segregation protein Spo0J